MFEGALNRGPGAKPRLLVGAVLSIAAHAALLAGAIWLSSGGEVEPEPVTKEPRLVVLDPSRIRKGTGGEQRFGRQPTARPRRKAQILQPTDPTKLAAPPEIEPPPELDDERLDEADEPVVGDLIGEGGGSPLGECEGDDCEEPPPECAEGGCATGPAEVVHSFGPDMKPPVRLGGEAPVYTRHALEARVRGTIIVRCVVPLSGQVRDCRVLKSLPHLDEAVLQALATWRYAPATLHGEPVAVDYVFTIKLEPPGR